jgi:lysophospholipase L1-like esterase
MTSFANRACVRQFFRRRGVQFAILWQLLMVLALPAPAADDWVGAMQQVHGRFKGQKGTFAQFGDSITVTMAFWSPLAGEPRNATRETRRALEVVKSYMKPECWSKWKGPEFGSQGSMTIRWARENVDAWIKKLNPEAVVIMFGSNDVDQMEMGEYERTVREVVRRCLDNGSVVTLTTAPPRSNRLEKSKQFAEAVRRIAREEQLQLIDYSEEIFKRRPSDWDGSLPQFKDGSGNEYEVPTLIARDGVHPSNPKKFANDFSDEALRTNGYGLRNNLTLQAYAGMIQKVLSAPVRPRS